MSPHSSPFAPLHYPDLPVLEGIDLASGHCGVRYQERDDLMLIVVPASSTVAGVTTQSKMPAAPVSWSREVLARGRLRAIVANSGNANSLTGRAGSKAVETTVERTAELLACPHEEILVASTGVIGVPLAAELITNQLPILVSELSPGGWLPAARSIMTTDTYPKVGTQSAAVDDALVSINGIAKGGGMIGPDMATLLGFIFTDAVIEQPVLQALISEISERTFNSITVEGDTSTNDMAVCCSTGRARHRPITRPDDQRLDSFRSALEKLMLDLAQQIVRDGEGISKFVTVRVTGACDDKSAQLVAKSIANSPLVKTACCGSDANWGRIMAAAGKSGEPMVLQAMSMSIGGHRVVEKGSLVDSYDETPVAKHMQGCEIDIQIDLGVGWGRWTIWTCDLTTDYIHINASYRS